MPPAIQPSYQSFCRLIQNDDSSDFSFVITYQQEQKIQQIEIKTTLNKARIISRKVNTSYQADPTIQSIEINIPFHLKLLKDQTQIKEKIENIFQKIIESSSKPITVSEEEVFLLTLLLRSIDYQEKDDHVSFEFTKFISTIEEAISLLSTSFHLEAVKFLSEHFVGFLKSGMFQKIEEEIIFDVIDFYIRQNEEQNISEKSDEYEQIFNVFKDNEEPLFLMHFLLQIDEKSLNNDMIEYIINHIDGEIASKETAILAEIAKKYFHEKEKKIYNFKFDYTGSLQTLIIPNDGNYEIEAIGAAGSGGNTYGTNFTSKGGKGAKIVASFPFKKGEVIDIVVGGIGTSKQATQKEGTSGGGGGGTFIFKRIEKVTDERFQFTKGDIKYETLLVAAGGSGSDDSSNCGRNSTGHDGEASNYKSPYNFTEYSKYSSSDQLSDSDSRVKCIPQFIEYDGKGTFCENGNGISRGGYGCGGSAYNGFVPGGGWCQGSNVGQATSWSLDANAIGTDGFNKSNGSVTVKYKC
ncbi:hypothetical protein M9Y10_000228 [Tritrichomonas musculus]|uniref:Uncharacterized protein n=1 Tax=Tritrichomonas musculus TaxID=1915356 RepID=A0ABR2L3P9_9EUKA